MTTPETTLEPQQDPAFEALLHYMKRNRGFDFTGYKRSSLARRIGKRMKLVDLTTYGAYQDYLEVHPQEFNLLFNTILINFTDFYRDPEAWAYLGSQIVPRILESHPSNHTIRIWSAGSASGEEAYTAVMVFAETLGIEEARERIKVYATDVDEHALAQARQGTYTEREVRGVPLPQRERYFERKGELYVFRSDLRRAVIFGRHDLLQDAPISRLNLLICRNTLIYFNRDAQKRILRSFHFALHDEGYLFLGRAEMLLAQEQLFEPESMKHRVFSKSLAPGLRRRWLFKGREDQQSGPHLNRGPYEMAFEASPVAQVLLDADDTVVVLNERARTFFDLTERDRRVPFRDLKLSYRPAELRSVIDQVRHEQRIVKLEGVKRTVPGKAPQFLDIRVVSVPMQSEDRIGIHISFIDVTQRYELRAQLQQAQQVVEATNEQLQSTNEELETSNEELQSTVEELQTTNEELQSTNAEMETVNEELQAANEELQSVNEELHARSQVLDQLNFFLNSILASVDVGIVVIDRDYRILLWNDEAEEMWGPRSDEVRGRSLLSLDIGLPVEKLVGPLQAFWNDGQPGTTELVLDARDRRGQPLQVLVTMSVRVTGAEQPQGVVLLMKEVEV